MKKGSLLVVVFAVAGTFSSSANGENRLEDCFAGEIGGRLAVVVVVESVDEWRALGDLTTLNPS